MNAWPRMLTFLMMLALAPAAFAKGVTVKIGVTGPGLAIPLAITDFEVTGQFSIWTGPQSRWRDQDGTWHTDYSNAYIDFPAGTVHALPEGLLSFDIEFFVAGMPDQPPIDETYKVRYALAPGEKGGYVYLPRGNPFIYHGVEGHWFRSTDSWEALVRPLIEAALEH